MSAIRVYVAGAYNSDSVLGVLENMRKGIRYSIDLIKVNISPFCPWLDFQYGLIADLTLEQYLRTSMAWLEVARAVFVVPGWENSKGTKTEIKRAEELGIPVFYKLDDLLLWCKEKSM